MTASTSPVVQLSGVRIDRGGRTILRDVSLEVPRGSITAVLGPSGSGKSTMLAALTGELRPVAGTVTLFGNPIPTGSRALLEMRRNVGVLLQGNGLLTDLSVAENVALPLRTHTRLPAAVLQRLVQMKLHAVGLLAAADAWPREVSGGMARRVALARALALDHPRGRWRAGGRHGGVQGKCKGGGLWAAAVAGRRGWPGGGAGGGARARGWARAPPLMIYDEPLTGLDPIASGVIMSLIQRLNDSLGLTSIIVSHHVHETLPICDQAVVIANGGIVFAGTPAQLQDSTDPLVQQFLHGQPDGPIAFDAAPRRDRSAA
ncbi:ATP-binding cassette domain-containing protein [Xanthomonas perforans]